MKVAFSEGDANQDVARALTQTAAQIAGEFQKSLDFFLASHPDTRIERIYLAGGSARVPTLLTAVESRARVAVEIMEPFRGSNLPPHLDAAFLRSHGAQAAASLGLALRSPGDKFE
jgi:type IV pilus assembly protein PilM